ncbi:uncharacterized protein K452DRAFT_234548 [Aplosporella prunicola CBS 121167]|uniref:Peptidase S28 n=1 Tax=Aplosporella prunicola CBS 121167 TaxID=1176127 RepID=A0A6A6B4E8_9PEZI|nr:uncharacterized protein K452DRAFT_234548 [Aplosporella prunicola CBS 121167]KAF2138273.1 hypothetical protein K452DRAFT_234548 [Aplosporella prunicola CBS 121167]
MRRTEETSLAEYVELPLDHFGTGHRTFKNRFWVAESGYKGAGHPVFIYDAGESSAGTSAHFRLHNKLSFFKQLVDSFGGIGIVWEHRYYGESSPVPIDKHTPLREFKYLTSAQALADVPVFAWNFSRENFPEIDLTPASTPWIFVGGSYPGMRAAFMRETYPETIFASYASSAPVEARTNMSVYFEPVYRGLNAYGFGNCTKDIHAAILYMDNIMANESASKKLKEQFLGHGAGDNSNGVFAEVLESIFYTWQAYGVEGGLIGLRNFCDWLETDETEKPGGKTAGAKGWASTEGPQYVVDKWARYPNFVTLVNAAFGTDCEGPTKRTSRHGDCSLAKQTSIPASISWLWQSCTEWGFLQSANIGDTQIVSRWNSLEYQRSICDRQFPDASPVLPQWPQDVETNNDFGGWDIRPSNTFWSGGEFDPWRTLSPLSSEDWAPQVDLLNYIPACNVSMAKSEIFGYVIPNAQHCYDFQTAFADGEKSRNIFTRALEKWLKCFKSANGYSY